MPLTNENLVFQWGYASPLAWLGTMALPKQLTVTSSNLRCQLFQCQSGVTSIVLYDLVQHAFDQGPGGVSVEGILTGLPYYVERVATKRYCVTRVCRAVVW